MFGSEILEVAIGIVFVYLLVSLICSAVREGIETFLKTRSAYLEYGIRELLHDPEGNGLAKSLYTHPLIYGLYLDEYRPLPALGLRGKGKLSRGKSPRLLERGTGLPSYIPSRNFAVALMDLAARGQHTSFSNSAPESTPISLESIRANVRNLQNEGVQRALLTAIDTAENDLRNVQANLEAWYDSSMDRVSGWYKRSTQLVLFIVGLFVAIAFNVNTITIADYLYRNDAARQAVVARAESAARDSTLPLDDYTRARAALDSLSLPVGWQTPRNAPFRIASVNDFWVMVLVPVAGWLMTALAATLGAPFWFDVLNKVMVIRSTVKPREKSQEEGSEDRLQGSGSKDRAAEVTEPVGTGTAAASLAGPSSESPPVSTLREDMNEEEAEIDSCDLEMEDETPDEDLPPARGGVA